MKYPLTCCLVAFIFLHISAVGLAQTAVEREPFDELRITWKEVSAVQTELNHRGHYRGEITGILDKETRQALRDYQSANELPVTGRIDRATMAKLGLRYPASGKERDGRRRNGIIPRVGYAASDGVASTGKTIGGAAKAVGLAGKAGAEKMVGATTGAAAKTEEVAQTAGEATVKAVGRGTRRAARQTSGALAGRSDAEINRDVREVLESDGQTSGVKAEVKSGEVTLTTKPEQKVDLSAAIAKIRQIEGVQSVMVISQ